jgi:hypothetical protein
MWAYVQYIGQDGKNLSFNTAAAWPDTVFSKSLGIVPQVFTVFGVPIWDTNTVDFTLIFPPGAHTARLLYCGLGHDVQSGAWRQYFPSNAYPNMVAPTVEVVLPATLTGIFTIGLNAFALASDTAISEYWASVNGMIKGVTSDFLDAIESLGNVMTPVETLGMAVTGGYATYEDVAHGDASNVWSLVLSIASMIPKLLFTQKSDMKILIPIAAKVIAVGGGTKIAEAIPIIGEVLGVLSLVGDVATLAEVSIESGLAPWVIENEISLQYSATITVKPDHRNAGGAFPETATAWTLTAQQDGADALAPISGTINDVDGHVQTSPLVVTATAPFGGKTMKWSIVFTDEYGFQVGTGVSPALTNDDPESTDQRRVRDYGAAGARRRQHGVHAQRDHHLQHL